MTQNLDQGQLKKLAAEYAFKHYVKPDMMVGVGTGSTVKYFIEKLAEVKHLIQGTVSSSHASTLLLQQLQIPVFDLNSVDQLDVYIDGADEVTKYLHAIKGGGAALTREKILAANSKKFVCIVDESKVVDKLGKFPLPIEVIPMARSYVAREMVKLGGIPDWRNNVVTDNGNWILDVHELDISDPVALEKQINSITGVVTNGIFAMRAVNELVVAHNDGTINVIK
jgi:ribose 5-phosphate isomerase A